MIHHEIIIHALRTVIFEESRSEAVRMKMNSHEVGAHGKRDGKEDEGKKRERVSEN